MASKTTSHQPPADPGAEIQPTVQEYMDGVLEGRIVACELVKQCVRRHLTDLKRGRARALVFTPDRAIRAILFFRFLKHSKGEWAGKEFRLSPWQLFILWVLFGWYRDDGTRRFRRGYIEVARKNGKSTFAAGIGILLGFGDGEPGAEVYAAATKKDQARIVHGEAVRMVKASTDLIRFIQCMKDNLHRPASHSKFEPLGADEDTMDGLNVHGGIIDELHAHKTRGVWDALDTATGSRRQPLLFAITTAGVDQTSVCWDLHVYVEQILSGVVEDDAFFGFIAGLDPDDRWTDPAVWPKANPNLGVSKKLEYMVEQCRRAEKLPSAQNAFLRLDLNRWTQQLIRWLPLAVWDASAGPPVQEASLAGRRCFGGLDLSSVSDLTAWVLLFPHADDPECLDVLCRFWCPEAKLTDDTNRYREQYEAWARAGLLLTTPGNAIDYAAVKAQVLRDAATFQLLEVSVDRLFQGYQLSMELQEEGLTVAACGMGFLSMAGPTAELERRLLRHRIRHAGHPLLRWMANNVTVKTDPAGNMKPDKSSSQGKIDGIVALLLALDRVMRHQGEARSIYDDREVTVL